MAEAKNVQVMERAPDLAPAAPVSETSAIVSMIERAARDPAVDIDKMERLMKMHQDMQERQAKVAYDVALAEMQPELPIVGRRGLIEVREKDNAGKRTGAVQQSTPYALWEDINEAIRPKLKEYGFALSFRTGLSEDGRVTVTGILSHKGGHREETTIVLQHDSSGSKNAVQAVGSSFSYGKRYTAIALLNITSRGDDDDGNAAGAPDTITDEQVDQINKLLIETKSNLTLFLKTIKLESLTQIRADKFEDAMKLIRDTAAKRAQRQGAAS